VCYEKYRNTCLMYKVSFSLLVALAVDSCCDDVIRNLKSVLAGSAPAVSFYLDFFSVLLDVYKNHKRCIIVWGKTNEKRAITISGYTPFIHTTYT
ncbi:MAG: hypothetical protein ACOCWH_01435, partial [Spirochaetota bacterium]